MTRSVILRSEATKDLNMRIRNLRSLAALGMTVALACTSAAPDSKKAPLEEPEIQITQLSNVAEAARNITGPISVQYRVAIQNRAKVPITIKRVDVISIGSGAYNLRPTSTAFNVPLSPGEASAVEFWAPASISDPTILGANGPVTVRTTVYYDSPLGASQSIVVQQVHAGF